MVAYNPPKQGLSTGKVDVFKLKERSHCLNMIITMSTLSVSVKCWLTFSPWLQTENQSTHIHSKYTTMKIQHLFAHYVWASSINKHVLSTYLFTTHSRLGLQLLFKMKMFDWTTEDTKKTLKTVTKILHLTYNRYSYSKPSPLWCPTTAIDYYCSCFL